MGDLMGVPGADVRYVLESLAEIEAALCNGPPDYETAVELLKELQAELEQSNDETEGDPIGWTIVATGDDGSVLCESPIGNRRRYWFKGKVESH